MCVTCGCSETNQIAVTDPEKGDQKMMSHDEAHAHSHPHSHDEKHSLTHEPHDEPHDDDRGHHSHTVSDSGTAAVLARSHSRTIELEKEILGKNQLIAERNRSWLAAKGILALNLVSSPGSGKTTLLEQTILALKNEFEIGVIEGDQETIHDAERIRATGCKAVQINTGTGCHLEADMLERGIKSLDPPSNSLCLSKTWAISSARRSSISVNARRLQYSPSPKAKTSR